jgi:hypothetical protein
MSKPDYFMHLNLDSYGKIGLIEGKGKHLLSALCKSQLDKSCKYYDGR